MSDKEVEPTNKDYEMIMESAGNKFRNFIMKYGDVASLCKCYFSAILEYTKKKGWIIKDGKIYKE